MAIEMFPFRNEEKREKEEGKEAKEGMGKNPT
jgi:hypothetical protein